MCYLKDYLSQTTTDKSKSTGTDLPGRQAYLWQTDFMNRRCTFGVLILLNLILSNCKTAGQHPIQEQPLEQLVREKLGDSTSVEYNDTKTYALFRQTEEYKKMNARPIHYIVVRLKDKTIVQNGDFIRGYVKWTNTNTIEVLSLPGKVEWNKDLETFKKQIIIDTPATKPQL